MTFKALCCMRAGDANMCVQKGENLQHFWQGKES
jgi:hypothetical protein